MLTFSIFFTLLVIPLLYLLYRRDLSLFILYSVFTFWIPIVLPFGSIFGLISIPEFFVYAGYVYYIFNRGAIKNVSNRKINQLIKISFVLLFIGCITSMMSSISSKYLLVGFRLTFIFPLALLFILSKIEINTALLCRIAFLLSISLLIFLTAIYSYPKTFAFEQYRGLSQEQYRLGGEYMFFGKYSGVFYEATIGAFLGFIIPFLIPFYRVEKSPIKKAIYIFSLLIITVSLILTAGRSGWIAATVGIVIIYLGSLRKGQRIFALSLIITLTISFIYLIFGMIAPTFTVEGKLFERVMSLANIGQEGNFMIRVYQWIWAWDTFTKNPLGIGFWNFTVITNSLFAGNSTWLTMLLNVGFIGSVGFIIIFFHSLYISLKKLFTDQDSLIFIGLFASLVSFTFGATTENFFDAQLYTTFPFWLIVGIIQNYKRSNNY